MKKITTLISLFFTSMVVFAQCPPGNVTLTTQAEVDQFAIDYPNCTQISGILTIDGDNIINLDGLNNITGVTVYMAIQNNAVLENVNGLENITTLGASLSIINNPALLNLNGLTGLNNIGKEMQISNNALLQSISSLSNVSTVGGGIWITMNPQLQTLNGLQNIQQVGGDIEIAENTILNDISFLENIDPLSIVPSGTYGLTIVNNPNVPVCNLTNFCTYLANPSNTHPRNISGNLADCLNAAAVVAACNLSVPDVNDYRVSYYPNPVKDIFNLSHSEEIESISVMNTIWQMVLSQNVGSDTVQIDMNSLPSGNYFVKIVASEAIRTVKIIKL